MTAPTVSVVMAAYNGGRFLRETIESVLAQTMADFEIVVADDGSTDDTIAVLARIADPRLRVVRAERNGGPAHARTLAMRHARGRYIAGLDQDDVCHPERFARQLAYLDAHPDIVLVASTITMFGHGPDRADPWPELTDPDRIDWVMALLNPLAWSSVLIRGEAARALTPFERDDYRFAEDFDLYARIREQGRIGRIAEPLVRYRLHPGGASQAYESGMIEAAARVLARRYAPLMGEAEALEAGRLMSRHAGASYAPSADALARCGAIMAALLATEGQVVPDFAAASARALWWRMARTGLRAGRYGPLALARARPDFAGGGSLGQGLRDAAIGTARRISRRG